MAAFTRIRRSITSVVLLTTAAAMAQQGSAQHARVELLARQASVKPRSDLKLGVHFILEKGWHIYWINPGDSGQPPSFKWQLPADFTAGQIQWPRPERIQPNKELADFGYYDEVLLPINIHVPSRLGTRNPVEFAVEVKWLICREVCIPEHANLHLALPVSRTERVDQQHAQLFAKTAKLIPQALPRAWNASATSAKDDFILTIRAGKPVRRQNSFLLILGRSITLRRKSFSPRLPAQRSR